MKQTLIRILEVVLSWIMLRLIDLYHGYKWIVPKIRQFKWLIIVIIAIIIFLWLK